MSKSLTIAELSRLTGITAATLRAWESRHGFPRPSRPDGGHRRYREADAEAVRAVVAERASGATLVGAIDRVVARAAPSGTSLFAVLRRTLALEPREVSKPTMVALSHALEDELSLHGERGLLVGAFQERRFFAQVERRWRALARAARRTAVFADFPRPRGDGLGSPARIPIPPGSPLEREWAIVHLAPRSAAVLVGRQLPGRRSASGLPRFDLVWSLDPAAARDSVTHVARLAEPVAPELAAALEKDLEETTSSAGIEPHFATALSSRAVAYLDRRLGECR